MITLNQYVGKYINSKDFTMERKANAIRMLVVINDAIMQMQHDNVLFQTNPATNSQVSGQTDGGFREQSCPIGAPNSAHKEGLAVDIYDPHEDIDNYLTENPEFLVTHCIYREHPSKTIGWCHLTIRSPASGKSTFFP